MLPALHVGPESGQLARQRVEVGEDSRTTTRAGTGSPARPSVKTRTGALAGPERLATCLARPPSGGGGKLRGLDVREILAHVRFHSVRMVHATAPGKGQLRARWE